jgi:uncharacterized pyridoxamine 5'-phosphate oxidase family protein
MTGTEFLEALRSRSEVELAVKRAGRRTTRPVWFVVDGTTVYLLPMYGTDTKWYKHVTANPEIELSVGGRKVGAQARPLLDTKHLTEVTNHFRSKYGELERYYRKLDVAIAVTI